ncbi:MAG: hypothetical protein EYC70_04305 [Planctomycetota bacterium]|nr:MAG: hypothetical protein EYC70_04305 [Planctomycetota bacterium]
MRRDLLAWPAAALIALLCAACSRSAPPRLNVLLISIDSLRADRLGCYGHRAEYAPEVAVSPNLDALAARGVAFDSAWSTTSWTLPAHMALLTGLPDRLHGVVGDEYVLNPQRRSLAQELRDAGYATAGFYSGPYLAPKYGFGRGFERYESAMTPLEQVPAERLEALRAQLGPAITPKTLEDRWSHLDVTSPQVNAKAYEFLQQQAGRRPFFLFLHYFDAHYDYLPDAAEPGLGRKFDPGYTGSMIGENWYFNPQVFNPSAEGDRRQVIGERDLHHVMALYDAEIHWVDRHIGQVLQKLQDLGVADRTLVCVVADHGDEFFEHGAIGHRSTLYEELTRIPLLLYVPGATPPGMRVRPLVRIYDIAPSLLDYACGGSLAESTGASLRPLIEGEREAPRSVQQRIYGKLYGRVNVRDGYRDGRYAVLRQLTVDTDLTDEHSLHLRQRQWEDGSLRFDVFDKGTDRGEHVRLAPADPRYREALAAACAAHRDTEARARRLPRLHPDPAPPLTPEEWNNLQQLGYVDVNVPPEDMPPPRLLAPFPPPCAD